MLCNLCMAIPILVTKLYLPPHAPQIVIRPRLIERLTESLSRGHKLILASAPAGFGKTTLISEWVANCGQPVAWLSLDENDHDPVRFLTYLIRALQTISPHLGAGIMDTLQSSQSLPMEAVLTSLLNEIAALPHAFILVLDDYHMLDSRPIDQAFSFFVDHLPPQMHLVITTREDPALPIPRLRARNQMIELRAADLRFTPSEAAEFLNQVMGLSLMPEEVTALDTHTEGWVVGLQLAALSMKGRHDVSGFIQAFTGDHRYIVDYLVEEVLQRQPEAIRDFLLQTSILDRLNGSLCDAVTGQTSGQARLEALQRGNFFLIPLDDRRHWYRYHHLFAEVLRLHLKAEQPDQVSALHQRASKWHEQNGSMGDAIHHALAGADFEHAARLIESVLSVMRQSRQEATLLGWLQALPDDLLQGYPTLNVTYVGTLLQNGQIEGVEARLRDIEQWLATPEDVRRQPIYADEEEFQRLPGSVAMYRAAFSLFQGEVASTMAYARKGLELARDEDHFMRGAASSLLGLACWTDGDLATAYQMFSQGMAYLEKDGFISDVIGGCVTLADIQLTEGHLGEAMRIYERGLQLATKQGAPTLRGAADMHVGMSGLFYERNDLNTAEQHLLKSKALGELNELLKNPYRWRVAMSRIREAQGQLEDALTLLEEAEPVYSGDFSPNVRPILALKARIWLKQGELEKALHWAHDRKLSLEEAPSYLREFEYITFARLLLSQYQRGHSSSLLQNAMGLLERLLKAAEAGGRMGSAIEILVVQALALQQQKDLTGALASLEQAMRLAEPEGYIRIFLDEGENMAELLREADARGIMPAYTGELRSTFAPSPQKPPEATPLPAVLASPQPLIEPLSQRELEILRLFKTELSGPEIADELVIALSTLRTHTKNIYSKLNANSRRTAVKQAVELGLI